jgi:CBS domain containing-hemolysin-like protein
MSGWLVAAVGLVLSGAGVLAAAAASTVGRVELYRWAAGESPASAAADRLLEAPDRIIRSAKGLATLGLLIAGLGMAPLVAELPLPLMAAAVVLVGIPLILGAVYAVPRAMGRRDPEQVVRHVVPVLVQLASVLSPLSGAAAGARRARPPDREPLRPPSGREDLPALAGVLAFSERSVREVMTPRTEIVATREGESVEALGRLFAESGYSRVPAYRDSLDHIVGMVYAFDLLKITPGSDLPLRPITTTPGSKRAGDLLLEMQRERRQMAVVLDEFGGTAGIVTFEDLLEELVGEIFDEHDRAAPRSGETVQLVEVQGTTPVEDVAAAFDVQLPEHAETIAGLLTRLAGRIPVTGERYALAGLEFDVLAGTPNRLERILIRRGPAPVTDLSAGSAP